ncbi:MAG: glycoside hydrolase family 9 protein [Alphaproteobacteria bacterium]|nr:glycoside hydrolase family 9 protein [Alphaproteobacteria bacterium]MDE2494090.1 glycoside hydrolase family 9 protein [Alphaproteobacteria bacterium]
MLFLLQAGRASAAELKLNGPNTFERQGLSVLVYTSKYHPVFRDQKIGGIEIILHDNRIATDGEVRLQPTPEQWDTVPTLTGVERGPLANQLIVSSGYPDAKLEYKLIVTAEKGGFRVAVHLDQPLPAALAGKAGFNLDFLPTAYFGKSYILDDAFGIFPRHPQGPVKLGTDGKITPEPMATGKSIVLSPGDPLTRVAITSDAGPLMLYDARDNAQNGWFVVRTLIPTGRSGDVVVWHVHPHAIPGWTRKPVVSFNQVGYTPGRSKIAMIELDPLYKAPQTASLLRLGADGRYTKVFSAKINPWGKWLRYDYATFDFSSIREPGVYAIEYAGQTFDPFRIAPDLYAKGVWQPSLGIYIPEQMDHVKVRENYLVWHGVSHMDDARQAPPNTVHFDGYTQGSSTESPFKAGEHIPGLNVGGWTDAGDFDIRTETQDRVVRDLAMAKEVFHVDWDQTTVDEAARSVEIRKPDGVPDAVEQVKHGVLQLLAQYDIFGHAIPGIIAPTLQQYTHLGDATSKTDGKIYDPKLGPNESNGDYSGIPDDRWAFTTHTTPLNYDAASALAAASRVLRGYDDRLAQKCLDAAVHIWDQEQKTPPALFHSFNTTGGDLEDEEVTAAVELVLATKGPELYKTRLKALLPDIQKHFAWIGGTAARAIPYMDADYRSALKADLTAYKPKLDAELAKNPFGVPITGGGWAGSGIVVGFAVEMYELHEAFPDIVGADYTLRAFDYLLGRHPVNNLSLVSTVGTESKLIGYGHNRADYSFIPGGVVPGVLIVPPDFPELKTEWPYLWYENEYVVDEAATFVDAANAAEALTRTKP